MGYLNIIMILFQGEKSTDLIFKMLHRSADSQIYTTVYNFYHSNNFIVAMNRKKTHFFELFYENDVFFNIRIRS